MSLGWKRIKVIFETHETMAGFLEKEDDNGLTVLVMAPESTSGVPGLWFFPWHNIASVYNVDSKKELNKRQKGLMSPKKTSPTKSELVNPATNPATMAGFMDVSADETDSTDWEAVLFSWQNTDG